MTLAPSERRGSLRRFAQAWLSRKRRRSSARSGWRASHSSREEAAPSFSASRYAAITSCKRCSRSSLSRGWSVMGGFLRVQLVTQGVEAAVQETGHGGLAATKLLGDLDQRQATQVVQLNRL